MPTNINNNTELLHLVWQYTTMAEDALRDLYYDPKNDVMQKAVIFYAELVKEAREAYRQATAELLMKERKGKP